MNHEVFQYRDEWYYFKEGTSSECTSGCDFPKSPGCGLVKREAGLPLCEGRTIKKLKPDIFAFGDTIVVVGTGREYRVVQSSITGNRCAICEFRTACRYGAEKYCPVFCTLQRIDTIQSQPQPAKHSVTPIMPKVIRLSMRNYVDENNNIYDLRDMPRLFNVGDRVTIDGGIGACENYVCRKVSSFNTPGKSCSLLNCKAESFCRGNSYLCKHGTALVPETVDVSARYTKKNDFVLCSTCAANILNSGCCAHVIEAMNGIENHVTCDGTFHYVKEPQQSAPLYNANLQSSNKPSNQLTRCRIEDGVNSYSCIIDIDKIEKHHLIEHPTSISCSACILSNLTTKPCYDVIGACTQYDKAWIINPQCMDSLIEQQILRIANIGYIKGTDPIINSKPPLTPKESFPVEKHITIKRSNFKPKITKLKEVKWKTQTTKNR